MTPPPAIFAGRRLWERKHLVQAAENLGLLSPELRERLSEGLPSEQDPGYEAAQGEEVSRG